MRKEDIEYSRRQDGARGHKKEIRIGKGERRKRQKKNINQIKIRQNLERYKR
jgi:hypothetical protein